MATSVSGEPRVGEPEAAELEGRVDADRFELGEPVGKGGMARYPLKSDTNRAVRP